MYFRTFFFLLFIVTAMLFFLSSYAPSLTLDLCASICYAKYSLAYIQLTSVLASTIALILLLITNYYTEKNSLKEKEKIASDRLNIEQIHAELEALKN